MQRTTQGLKNPLCIRDSALFDTYARVKFPHMAPLLIMHVRRHLGAHSSFKILRHPSHVDTLWNNPHRTTPIPSPHPTPHTHTPSYRLIITTLAPRFYTVSCSHFTVGSRIQITSGLLLYRQIFLASAAISLKIRYTILKLG